MKCDKDEAQEEVAERGDRKKWQEEVAGRSGTGVPPVRWLRNILRTFSKPRRRGRRRYKPIGGRDARTSPAKFSLSAIEKPLRHRTRAQKRWLRSRRASPCVLSHEFLKCAGGDAGGTNRSAGGRAYFTRQIFLIRYRETPPTQDSSAETLVEVAPCLALCVISRISEMRRRGRRRYKPIGGRTRVPPHFQPSIEQSLPPQHSGAELPD